MGRKTLVLAEVRDGNLRQVSYEAIAAGKKISEGGEVVSVLLGEGVADQAEKLGHYGADRVLVAESESLKNYTPDAYKQVLKQIIDQESPEAIVIGHTGNGKDISAVLAARLNSALISDVTEISDDLTFTRPIYAGKAFEKKRIKQGPVFVTIRPNNIAPLEKNEANTVSPETVEVNIQNLRTIIKDIVKKTAAGGDLSEAKIVISGGRGVKSKDGFEPLKELADVLGGVVGASRGACDADYCDYSLQIGQTGKVVTPDLYIACGISGAIQHLAGMSNSKVIVAINKDAEANIFNVADYGIVGDLFEVVPLLTKYFKEALQEA